MAVPKSISLLFLRRRMLSSSSITFSSSDLNSKLKWGGHGASDPYRKKKTKVKAGNSKMERLPLKSEEQALKDLHYRLNFQSLNQLISDYVPLEKFVRLPIYTLKGISQRFKGIKESMKNIHGIATVKKRMRKIDPLKPKEFARWGQEQFIAANVAIQNQDKASLRSITTESASETLKSEFQNKVFNWKFIKEIERPRIVSVRVAPLVDQDNMFGQLIVRLRTQQIMAVYDFAGRLVRGHPSKPKDVIDYVVFERSLSATDAQWRICAKIPPQIRTQ